MRSACRMWFLFHNQQPLLPAEFHSLPISFGNFHRVCIHLNGKQNGKFAMHKKSVSGKMALGSVLFFNEGNVTRLLASLVMKETFLLSILTMMLIQLYNTAHSYNPTGKNYFYLNIPWKLRQKSFSCSLKKNWNANMQMMLKSCNAHWNFCCCITVLICFLYFAMCVGRDKVYLRAIPSTILIHRGCSAAPLL